MNFYESLPNPYEVKLPPVFKESTLFNSLDITVIDIETTGLDPLNDRIISVGLYRSQFGKILAPYYVEIDPEIIIPPYISALTSISNYSLKRNKAPVLDNVIDQIVNYVGDSTLVAHNAQFDRSFVNPQVYLENGYAPDRWIESNEDLILKSQFGGNGREWLCTYRLAWHCFLVDYGYDQIVLKNEALRYWLEPKYIRTSETHNAKHDALTTLRIFQHICSYAEHRMGVKTLEDLFKLNNTVKSYNTMPFGEHKGVAIKDVPNDYIEYGLRNFDRMDYELGLVLQAELNRRKTSKDYVASRFSNSDVGGSSVDSLMNVGGVIKPKFEKKPIPEKVLKEAALATAPVEHQLNHRPKQAKPKPFAFNL